MTSKTTAALPPLAPYPESTWRTHLPPEEWIACLDSWILLIEAHLSLPTVDFSQRSSKDESLPLFLLSYVKELADTTALNSSVDNDKEKKLRKLAFRVSSRLLEETTPPTALLQWEYLADLSKAYGKKTSGRIISSVWNRHLTAFEESLSKLKNALISELESGVKGRPDVLEQRLKRLNHLIHSSSDTAIFFMSGSDFLDGLVSCYKLMNPPLRKAIITTTYLCLIGLTEGKTANISLLTDQLYSLKTAAEAHKAGPTNSNDSLVVELVSSTPILNQLQRRLENNGNGSGRAKTIIASLESFAKSGVMRPKKFIKRKIDKGKGVNRDSAYLSDGFGASSELHFHRLSLISQVQDLFPDLGPGFVVKLLDEYNNDVEQVIAHLLEDSLPEHLRDADRAEQLDTETFTSPTHPPNLAPRTTPPLLPTRRNVFDDDALDQLTIDASKLHFGRRNPDQTADAILQDRTSAPNKAAILSALAAFDSDDDERDDTYDVEDVGGTVDSAAPGNNPEEAAADTSHAFEELLFRTYKSSQKVFDRDATTRRGQPRAALREATGMTDEAIEGWALMLSRDQRQQRRLEAKYSAFSGAQHELASSAWRAEKAGGSGTEDSDLDGGQRGRGGGGQGRGAGRGRGRGRGGRGGQGNVAGPTGEKGTEVARQRKEANKGSRANHNRRDQRARKMARGGFPG